MGAAKMAAAQQDPTVIVVGGEAGTPWQDGGGTIAPTTIESATRVEHSNTPGGVIDFEFPERANWIFPQRVDTTNNILLGFTSTERGGSLFTPLPTFKDLEESFFNIIDNDGDTALEVKAASSGESTRAFGLIIQFDLGAIFGVNRIRFFPRNADPDFPAPLFPFHNDFIRGYEIFANDGTPETQRSGGNLIWETIAIEGENEEAVVDLRLETRFIRHLRFKSLTDVGFEIAELQIFAEGFVPQATYVSNIYDFGTPALLGNLRWLQEQVGDAERSRMRIRTRTGDDPQPVQFTRVGVQASGRTTRQFDFEVDIPIEAPWKQAQDVEDEGLRELITGTLDNREVDGREALLIFFDLPIEQRNQISLSEEDYFALDVSVRGNLADDLNSWSAWSAPYSLDGIVTADQLQDPAMGTPVISPGPRRYFQFMIEFANDTFDAATGIGGLAFDMMQPVLADSLIGEILPRIAPVGEQTKFTYGVLSKIKAQGGGFDRLEIDTPLKIDAVGRIELAGADGTVQATDFSSVALGNLPATQNGFSVLEVRDDGFVIAFPRVEADSTLLKVEFDSAVLRVVSQFGGRALDGEALFGQAVLGGNAADLSRDDLADPDKLGIGVLNADNLSVSSSIARNLLINVAAVPAAFTPNGDGANDQVLIQYDITNIARPTPLEIVIYDLSGRRVRLLSAEDSSGRFVRTWDGLDDAGELVPPGQYIFRVSLDAGTGQEKRLGLVSVAY